MIPPASPLSTLRCDPSRNHRQDSRPEWSRFSFSVGLSHPLQCAGLSRRSLSPPSHVPAESAEKLKMNVLDLMRQCNGQAPPSKALVKGLARELDISESQLEKLAEEVRKDLQ